MAAEAQRAQLLVGDVFHQLQQPGSPAEKLLADVGAGFDDEASAYSPSTTSPMRLTSKPSVSRSNSRIPVAAPQDLDDVPAGSAECRFQFLHDLAVAAHRTVQALQVAVDDENQVVEIFARRQVMAPSVSGSSVSPSPRNAQTLRPWGSSGRDLPGNG